MTGSKSKNTINQMKFFFSRAKFRAFTDAMLQMMNKSGIFSNPEMKIFLEKIQN